MKISHQHQFVLLDYKHIDTETEVEQGSILVSYKGSMNHDTLGEISRVLRHHANRISLKVSRKLFAIFIEIAQNIAYYSCERNCLGKEYYDAGIGSVIIKEYDNHYKIIAGNVVTKADADKIGTKFAQIAHLNREELREYKRTLRGQGEELNRGNIGLLQIILTAHNPLNIQLTPLDEQYSFYCLSTNVDKHYTHIDD
jgi:hypothetical protein